MSTLYQLCGPVGNQLIGNQNVANNAYPQQTKSSQLSDKSDKFDIIPAYEK